MYPQPLPRPIIQQVLAIAHMNSSSHTGGEKRASLALHAPVLNPIWGVRTPLASDPGILILITFNQQSPGSASTRWDKSVVAAQVSMCHDSWTVC